jgi:nucleoside-diphosphate-sugar epimerase
VTLLDVLRELAAIFEVEAAVVHEDARAGDVPHSVADISRARVLLGYEPVVDLAEGLRRTTSLRTTGSKP